MRTATSPRASIARPPAQAARSTIGARTSATAARRGRSPMPRALRPGGGLASAESPAAAGERGERVAEVVSAKVGPERIREDELGIRELPEQEVRDALLARGADEQVGVRHLRRCQAT